MGGAGRASNDLLKDAEFQQTTVQDLEGAARLYQEFLLRPGTDRTSQAKAYLQLGICQYKMGQPAEAKDAWKKIVKDYADQGDSYAEALNQLQYAQAAERIVEVRTSTTVIVQKVYESPPATWLLEFPRGTFLHTVDGKGRLVDTTAGGSLGFVRFPTPNLGAGMELGDLGASGPPSSRRDIGYFIIVARAEKPIIGGLTFYSKAGTGLYFFNFTNTLKSSSKANIGGTLEAGFVIGLPRGFAFNGGYLFHTFLQSTPSQEFKDSIPVSDRPLAAEVTQNRGLRLVGGPDISLSLRW